MASSTSVRSVGSQPVSASESESESASECDRERLFVIGAGLSRSGTEAVSEALEILLGAPVYHGGSMMLTKGEGRLWRPLQGKARCAPDFERLFDRRDDGMRYSATFDVPGCTYVSELMERYPNYRVVLTKRRTADEWAKSVEETMIVVFRRLLLANKLTCYLLPVLRRTVSFCDEYLMVRAFGFTCSEFSHAKLVLAYDRHLAHIRSVVPADRLIEFTVGDGWEPLCSGLKLPIPAVAFPKKNERSGFMSRYGSGASNLLLRRSAGRIAIIVAVVIGLIAIISRLAKH